MTQTEPKSAASRGSSMRMLRAGLDLLEAFKCDTPAMSVADLARRARVSRSTAYELVRVLTARQYLVKSDGSKLVTLGGAVEDLAKLYQPLGRVMREAEACAERLSLKTGETVNVARLNGLNLAYLASVEPPSPVRVVSVVGVERPAHATAIGLALLACLPNAEVRAMYRTAGQLAKLTPATIDSVGDLLASLEDIRTRKYSVDHGAVVEDVRCVGAAIEATDGSPLVGVSISAPKWRWSSELEAQYGQWVVDEAAFLADRLDAVGGRAPWTTSFLNE